MVNSYYMGWYSRWYIMVYYGMAVWCIVVWFVLLTV